MKAIRIPLSRPDLGEAERLAVARVLEGDTLSIGPEAAAFEAEFAGSLGGGEAVAVSSGSAGLYLALRGLGMDGGEVITPSYGFVATAHAIRMCGATPRFADVDPRTLVVTPETLEAAWTPRVRAVVPVHLFGTPLPMPAIVDWAAARGVVVVEDACEAVGTICHGRPAGCWGEAGVFAFYPNKQMTTGEGGMIACRGADLARFLRSARNQGRGDGEFEFERFGFNFRLTELQCALGRAQLSRLDELLDARERVASRYLDRFADLSGVTTLGEVEPSCHRSWFVFPILLDRSLQRASLREHLAARGIQTAAYFPAIHRMPPYADPAYRAPDLRITESVSERSLAIPFHSRLRAEEVDEVVGEIQRSLAACRVSRA